MATVADIHFERAILVARLEGGAADLHLVSAESGERVDFEKADGEYRLNVTCVPTRRSLPDGRWLLDGAEVSPAVLARADSLSRDFPYDSGRRAWSVRFSAADAPARAGSPARADSPAQKGSPAAAPTSTLALDVSRRRLAPPTLKSLATALSRHVIGAAFALMRPIARIGRDRSRARVLFFKQNGTAPGANLAALERRMEERNLKESFAVTERFRDTLSGSQSPIEWLGDLWAIARSDYIFIDDYAPVFGCITLAPDAVLTQVWHAGVGFKALGYARFGLPGGPDPDRSPYRAATWAIVGSSGLRDTYAEVFGIERSAVLACGLPRLDHFLDEGLSASKRDGVLARNPVLRGRRVILFAPTFRGTGQRDACYPEEFLDAGLLGQIADLCERCGSIFAIKMHPYVKAAPEIPAALAERITDVSAESIDDLYHAADVLVTDYSSCYYDYRLLGRPIVFYTPDREAYESGHGVQRPVRDYAPGPVCDSSGEFVRALEETLGREVAGASGEDAGAGRPSRRPSGRPPVEAGHCPERPVEAERGTGTPTDVERRTVVPAGSGCGREVPAELDRCSERDGTASDRVIDAVLFGNFADGVLDS